MLDEIESGIIENLLEHEGIRLHPKNEIAEILSINGKINGVRLADGHVLKTDLLAYAIGIAARADLARTAGIKCERGIYVDEFMQTSQTDIFAAGDAAQVYDSASGKHLLDTLWNPAREQGWTAGRNMAGQITAYTKPPVFNVTRLAGLTVTIMGAVGNPNDPDLLGIARGDSETWRQVADAIVAQSGFDVNRLRLMVGEKHVLGAIVIGDQKLSYILQTIVRKKIDITPIRGQLLTQNANLADILADFWAITGRPGAERKTEKQ